MYYSTIAIDFSKSKVKYLGEWKNLFNILLENNDIVPNEIETIGKTIHLRYDSDNIEYETLTDDLETIDKELQGSEIGQIEVTLTQHTKLYY